VTWLTLAGVLLLPALVGGVLVAALHDPTERLDNMTAAIVNLDEPVTVQDQVTPLGRQLAAGLVEGSDEVDSNLTWVLSNEEDAQDGLEDGSYQAVVTIPEEFSAAATSSGQKLSGEDEDPQQATIEVVTAPDARLADEAITNQIASVAAASMGRTLSEATLSNVLIGFTTLGDELGGAADGASQLADGAGDAAAGADELADGAAQLGGGAGELATGATQLADGVGGISGGASDLADGANGVAAGAQQLATGLAGDGTAENPGLAPGLHQTAEGAHQLATQLGDGAAAIARDGLVPTELTGAAAGTAQAAAGVATGLDALSASCAASGAAPAFCEQLAQVTTAAHTADAAASGTSAGLGELATRLPAELSGQLGAASTGAGELAAGLDKLSAGADGAAAGASQLASGAGALAGGAAQLSDGAGQLAGGAGQLSTGAAELATGADQLATGTSALGDGIDELSSGTRSLADGLDEATEQIPSYSETEAEDIATVIADPVSASSGDQVSLFGASAVPLLAAVVLWFGGLASFLVMRSVTARALTSRRASVSLAGRALLPAALLGAVQGVLVAAVVQALHGYDGATAAAVFALCAAIGVAFAAVHQALVAVFGGAGHWIGAVVGAVAVATGIVSTQPGWLAQVSGALPTAPAHRALLGVLTEAGGTAGAVVALTVWAALSFIVTTVAVARKRTIRAGALLAGVPA
jgi:putative membrane protein